MDRKFIWLGMFVGSTIGGFIPALWNASFTSMWGLFLSAVGGILGIYIAFRWTRGY
jgi:hypothetical protein